MIVINSKPRVLLLADAPNWAFDYIAHSIKYRLKKKFNILIDYSTKPISKINYNVDLIYIFYWGHKIPRQHLPKNIKIIRDVASFAWLHFNNHFEINCKKEFVNNFLNDCTCATTPSAELYNELYSVYPKITHCPNGVEYDFYSSGKTTLQQNDGRLTIGWVGNPRDEFRVKGLHEILIPASKNYNFIYTDGNLSRADLKKFYSNIDILAIASGSETQPLPLLEAMSAGCFPVTTNVGIVPEIIVNGSNGLIVDRTIISFEEAFKWCNNNLEYLRSNRIIQKKYAQKQSWDTCVNRFSNLFSFILNTNSPNFSLPEEFVGQVNRRSVEKKCIKTHSKWLNKKVLILKINAGDSIRGYLYGTRFKKSNVPLSITFLINKINYITSVCLHFKIIAKKKGVLLALKISFKSFINQLSSYLLRGRN